MAQKFEEKKFNIPKLKGISEKNIEEHLKLYAGYVKNANLVLEKIEEMSANLEANVYIIAETQRRFGFEYNGMRNHEVYFESLSGGTKNLDDASGLKKVITEEFGSFDKWLSYFKSLATTRGIGWAMLYWDKKDKRLLNTWIDEQHIGQLQNCSPILALDMWEHAFVADYQPSGKKQYIEDFFENLNWQVIEQNFTEVI
ncbi:MAG: Fe-Mn family superoxide dismutase [Patescibacteria group bacterium]